MCTFTCNKGFFHYKPFSQKLIQRRPEFRKIRTLVWPLWNANFSFTDQKYLNFGRCIDIDDLTPPSKVGEVTRPSSHFIFYRPAFSAIYRLFYKIANLWDIDLTFSGFISDISSDNPAKYVKLAYLEVVFLKIGFLGISVCNLQTSQVMSKKNSDFVPPYWAWHLVKISWS